MNTILYREKKILIMSYCMTNIYQAVIDAQKNAFRHFGWDVNQVVVDIEHWQVLDLIVGFDADIYLIVDIDCVPLRFGAIEDLLDLVLEKNVLAGIEQSCNHKPLAEGHIYVGPACMCFTRDYYNSLSKPSFIMTQRGDVGQELTYRAEELGLPICFLRLTSSKSKVWRLGLDRWFGHGSNYSDMFYHQFQIRSEEQMNDFIHQVSQIIELTADNGAEKGAA